MESRTTDMRSTPLEALVGELFQTVGMMQYRLTEVETELAELKQTVRTLELESSFIIA